MVIYNEIIIVLKLIMFIFYQKQKKRIPGLRGKIIDNFKKDTEIEMVLKQQEDLGDDKPCEGYMLSKEIIMEAWARYRPVQSKSQETKPKITKVSDLKQIYPDSFLNKIMANIKLKQYDFKSTDKQIRRKKVYKENFL